MGTLRPVLAPNEARAAGRFGDPALRPVGLAAPEVDYRAVL